MAFVSSGCSLLRLADCLRRLIFVAALAAMALIEVNHSAVFPGARASEVKERETGSGKIAFAIEAQPLASALEAYSVVSRRQVIYNGNLAIGRQTAAVHGTFDVEEALGRLLQGTGLSPRYMAEDAFVLVPAPKAALPTSTTPGPLAARYYGLMQTRLLQTLCSDDGVMRETDRLAASFWIDSGGQVTRATLLDSTGDSGRDASVLKLLRQISVGASPPAGFAQPVTLVLSPRSAAFQQECRSMDAGMVSRVGR
ncbi:TonB family protein [Tardiphaga alba]|uniref:TonB family protein n=1 Tax=Tardiphaga alba TaxID=340268 RepID=A0ABX8AA65_9BRAD|nr:TonB family protein [Tardiphaga alba]QUS39896.1 TonB family protein [Tardiphaga alba]